MYVYVYRMCVHVRVYGYGSLIILNFQIGLFTVQMVGVKLFKTPNVSKLNFQRFQTLKL